jgi:hypothetical protein
LIQKLADGIKIKGIDRKYRMGMLGGNGDFATLNIC